MNLLKDLTTFDTDSNGAGITTVRVIIEIPKGTVHKYEYNPQGYFTIVRDLHKRYKYIYNYGCLPQTLGGDNDPLDAIVLSDEPIAKGTVVNCKVLGAIRTIDQGEVDDKIVCIPYYDTMKKVNLRKVVKYLNRYKYPYQKLTQIKECVQSGEALQLINEAVANYYTTNRSK